MEIDFGSSVDRDQEPEISDTNDEEDEHPKLKEDPLSAAIGLSELEDSDGEDEDHDEFEEFRWLKSINIPINADDTAVSHQTGSYKAKLVNRDSIQESFHQHMEERSDDTATVGFNVFNRLSCLKSEFMTSLVPKATGVRGPKLNNGLFLFIETLTVQERYERKC